MRMVAEKAGVHVSTVSLCLRDHPSIPASTRQRIRKLARQMGYRQNPLVSALMASIHTRRVSSESPVLGLIIESELRHFFEDTPYYCNLLDGSRNRAAQLGYTLENFYTEPGLSEARRLGRILHARNIRGVILAPVLRPGGKSLLPLEGLACAALGHSLHQPDIHRVINNYGQSMLLAWSKLLARGYRRPGFVHILPTLERLRYDLLGPFLAIQTFHPECASIPPLLFPTETGQQEEHARELSRWFKRHRPDVLISPPWLLLPLLETLGGHIRVPEETGVILMNTEPGWAQVRDNAELVGSGAVDMVVAQIHRNETGIPDHPKTMSINASWVDGFSLPDRRVTRNR